MNHGIGAVDNTGWRIRNCEDAKRFIENHMAEKDAIGRWWVDRDDDTATLAFPDEARLLNLVTWEGE